jgi:DNA-binding response OmpR family regulator/tetratricopeptide (TPR) repeat protein
MSHSILISEDNDNVAEPLERLLQKAGFETRRAVDGIDALSQLAVNAPDLLLLDLKMPRLNGVELLKKLRQSEKTKELPVIVMTGVYRGEKSAAAARSLGVTSYLEKPFRAGDLLKAIEQNLSLPSSSSGETIDRHLHRALISRFSGILNFSVNNRQQHLSFINGTPVSLRPGLNHENFGEFLFKRGAISAEEYSYYSTVGECRHDTLIELGCFDYPELMLEKLSYLGSELIYAFGLPPFEVTADPVSLPGEMQVISVNVPRLFYAGYHMHPQMNRLRALRQQYSAHFPILAQDFYKYSNFLQLKSEEQLFLQQLNGQTALNNCLSDGDALLPLLQTLLTLEMISLSTEPSSNAAAEGPTRTLFNMIADDSADIGATDRMESFDDLVDETDLVEVDLAVSEGGAVQQEAGYDLAIGKKVRQTLTEIKDKNYYEVFKLRQGEFSFDKLKSKYFSYTHEFGPELLMQLSGEEASLVEEILSIVTNAYNTLSDVVKKERYDELLGSGTVGLGEKGDDRFQAQVQSQSGKVFIEMEEWENAINALQDAVNIVPTSGDYLAHLGWAIYKNPANERSRIMRDRGKQMINKSMTLERTAAGHSFKGWLLLEAEQESLAEAEFNKALRIDARNNIARKGMRSLQEKREHDKKGLFRKMFR